MGDEVPEVVPGGGGATVPGADLVETPAVFSITFGSSSSSLVHPVETNRYMTKDSALGHTNLLPTHFMEYQR